MFKQFSAFRPTRANLTSMSKMLHVEFFCTDHDIKMMHIICPIIPVNERIRSQYSYLSFICERKRRLAYDAQ